MKERRRHRRIAIKLPVKWRFKKSLKQSPANAFFFDTYNITRQGIFLKTSLRPEKGSPVELEFTVRKGSSPIKLEGRVVWVAKKAHPYLHPGVGIEFEKVPGKAHKKLTVFLREKLDNFRDSVRLKKIYLKLKSMASELVELEERHTSAVHFRKVLDRAISEIDGVAHMLDKEINEIKEL